MPQARAMCNESNAWYIADATGILHNVRKNTLLNFYEIIGRFLFAWDSTKARSQHFWIESTVFYDWL